ncbi:SseB family protein [Rhizomonospora bruguierae]|uniref:SseB family protein n=1 Tax=Rhizomonospora bruguierae TaxID=1581705 RepID=UPI001BCB56A0|nr:SseB family protein [Micromonospora sp. NBRC 107566]
MSDWAPATEAEVAMQIALREGDQERYFQILARTELFLPVSADALAGRAPAGWGTWSTGGRTHVLAFTSNEALDACLTEHGGAARRVPYPELAAGWPNLEWWLAVNPGLPIEGYLPAWFVAQLARGDVRLPGRTLAARARVERAESVARARAAVPPRLTPIAPLSEAARASRSVSAAALSSPSVVPAGAAPGPVTIPPYQAAPAEAAFQTAPYGGPMEATPTDQGNGAWVPEKEPASRNGAATADRAEAPRAPIDPDFVPANDVESELLTAATDGNTDAFLSTLLLAKVLLPAEEDADPAARPGAEGFAWRTEEIDGERYVVVFTSRERLAAHLPAAPAALTVKFMHLILQWPDQAWSFAVNPGTAIGATLPGSQIVALASWAAEAGLGADDEVEDAPPAEEEPAPEAPAQAAREQGDGPTVMQKAIAPAQVDYYLERGYDRVSGFVHRAHEVAHLRTPTRLRAALGLAYEGSPFAADATEMYVLRWPAYRPSLYRIPYGGQHEAGMRAMEGWVIERPPFRGNGFAPGDSSAVVAEFKVDSARLPHHSELWRLTADGKEELIALLDADIPNWQRVGES